MTGAARTLLKATSMSMKMDMPKIIASLSPALLAAPALATVDVRLIIFVFFYPSVLLT